MLKNLAKIFLIIAILNNKFIHSEQTAIIFHHDGPSLIPSYSVHAFQQAAYFNSQIPIYVLARSSSINYLAKQNLPENINLVSIENIPKTKIHKKFDQRKTEFYKNAAFKGLKDLNWYCYDRFFSLYDFLISRNIDNVFLLENDNLLYCNLSKIVPHLKAVNIGFTAMSDKLIICGISFFKNLTPLKKLCDFIVENFDPGIVDFAFWPKFKNQFPDLTKDLPVITKYDFEKQKIKNGDCFFPTNLLDDLNSIFDHAAYGQYLCKAKEAKEGFINRQCVFDPSLITYEWTYDEDGRLAPFVYYFENDIKKMIKINNLHVHSKNLQQYKTY